jgi:hypothetical protein
LALVSREPTATQKLEDTHETPLRKFGCEAEVDSDAAELADQVLPFQVRIRFCATPAVVVYSPTATQ